MSSSKTNNVGAKILCILFAMSMMMGTRSVVNGGVVIPGSAFAYNRPSSLVSAATGLYMASKEGQITQAQAHQQGQYLIQANKDKVNLALVSQIGR